MGSMPFLARRFHPGEGGGFSDLGCPWDLSSYSWDPVAYRAKGVGQGGLRATTGPILGTVIGYLVLMIMQRMPKGT